MVSPKNNINRLFSFRYYLPSTGKQTGSVCEAPCLMPIHGQGPKVVNSDVIWAKGNAYQICTVVQIESYRQGYRLQTAIQTSGLENLRHYAMGHEKAIKIIDDKAL